MSDHTQPPAGQGDSEGADRPGTANDDADEAKEAALIQEVVRQQERHREGGIEPELDDAPGDHQPGA